MLEELLIDQRLNAGARDLLMTGLALKQKQPISAERAIAKRLNRLLTFDSRVPEDGRAIAFIGPRSCGRTTLIAKLAVCLRESFALSVGMISSDAERGGEGFHLGTFASLAGLPCVALPKQATRYTVERATEQLKDSELVLIDVPTGQERSLLANCDAERMLVLSANMGQDAIVEAALRYPEAESARLAITHVDRCGYSGPLVEALLEAAKPLGFFGLGPRVPQDAEPATARRLARMLTRTLQ